VMPDRRANRHAQINIHRAGVPVPEIQRSVRRTVAEAQRQLIGPTPPVAAAEVEDDVLIDGFGAFDPTGNRPVRGFEIQLGGG